MRSATAIRVLLASILLTVPLVAAEQNGAIRFVAEVKQDPANNLKLDWVSHTYVSGENLFVVSHRDGRINTFKRDAKTGEVKFANAYDVAGQLKNAGRHLDAYPALSETSILYVTGQWTHAKGNADSLGLNWYAFEPKDGSLTPLGTIPCDAGALQFSPDRKSLYLSAWFSHAICQIGLDAAGKPTVGAKVTGKGLGGAAVRSPDDRFLYSLTDQDAGWVEIKGDGALAYGGSCELAPLKPPDSLRAQAIAISPDGRHAYVALWTYKYNAMGLFKRDAKTGALAFAEALTVDPGMNGISQILFLPDGKTAYYCSCPENSGSGLGWFTRDPESGKLTFGGKAPRSGFGPGNFAFAPDSGTIYLAGSWGTKSFNIYSTR